jgi:hypothetical protein
MMHDHKERESLDEATLFAQSLQNLISVGSIETVQGVYGEVRYRLPRVRCRSRTTRPRSTHTRPRRRGARRLYPL